MVIPQRIKTIGDFIERDDIVVDVGADHGLLELYLIAKNQNILVTAVENKVGPYRILENNLKGLKNVKLSLSDGIECVSRKTKTVVLAGMGGCNIEKILSAYPEKTRHLKKIIVDAHRDIALTRKTIINFGFKFKAEKIVFEQGKFYVISEFIKANKPVKYSSNTLEIGYQLYKDELWPKYKEYLLDQNQKEIAKIQNINKMQDRVLKLQKLNKRIENYGKN